MFASASAFASGSLSQQCRQLAAGGCKMYIYSRTLMDIIKLFTIDCILIVALVLAGSGFRSD